MKMGFISRLLVHKSNPKISQSASNPVPRNIAAFQAPTCGAFTRALTIILNTKKGDAVQVANNRED